MAMEFLAGEPMPGLQGDRKARRRGGNESVKGFEVGYKPIRHQRQDAGVRRTDARKARRASAVPCVECQRRRDPQPGIARPCVSSRGARRQSRCRRPPRCRSFGSERPSASRRSSHMDHPGVWVMGDLDDDDRRHGMGVVVEYAGQKGKAQWSKPKPFRWDYTRFGDDRNSLQLHLTRRSRSPIVKNNAALDGFNQWTLNGEAFSMQTHEAHVHHARGAPLPAQVPQRKR